jgi:hypothetical protein
MLMMHIAVLIMGLMTLKIDKWKWKHLWFGLAIALYWIYTWSVPVMVLMKGNMPMIAWHSELYKSFEPLLLIFAIPHVLIALLSLVHFGVFAKSLFNDRGLPNESLKVSA